eukprot:3510601-Ditylum_brightwellii.AAC.1
MLLNSRSVTGQFIALPDEIGYMYSEEMDNFLKKCLILSQGLRGVKKSQRHVRFPYSIPIGSQVLQLRPM